MENFSELNLNESLKHSIARMHFKIPTPIQAQAIPPALLGKDILGTAQTQLTFGYMNNNKWEELPDQTVYYDSIKYRKPKKKKV